MNKSRKLAIISLVEGASRTLSGPLTLIVITYFLSDIEIGYYYIFLSLVAMKQLLELGVSNVLIQYISHESDEIKRIELCSFTLIWFALLAIIFFILSIFFGQVYFWTQNENDLVEWFLPWLLLLSSVSLLIFLNAFNVILDGFQEQIFLRIQLTIVNTLTSLSLCLFIFLGFGLYSIGMANLIAVFFRIVLIFYYKYKLPTCGFLLEYTKLKHIFIDIWPLLSKVSLVWFAGYFYWNGFNLVSFKILGPVDAGALGVTLALAKAGMDIAMSISRGQNSLYAYKIANGETNSVRSLFKKNVFLSFFILVLGYGLFIYFKYIFPDFYIFNKIVDFENMMWVFLFYISSFLISQVSNFIRAFKIEPFVIYTIIMSIVVVFSFYISVSYFDTYLLLPAVLNLISFLYVIKVYYYILDSNNKCIT